MPRISIERIVFKSVDIKRNHNKKFGIVYTGSRPSPDIEKILGKYMIFLYDYDS